MDHHYVPRFFLKNWENEHNTVYKYFKNTKGQIIENKKLTKSIGFKSNLYEFNKDTFFPLKDTQVLETEFFSRLDNDSALILKKIIKDMGVNKLSKNEKIIWAKFVHSLMERNPKEIEFKRTTVIQLGEEYLNALLNEKIHKDLTIKEFGSEIITEQFLQNESLSLLIRIIDDPHWNQWFCDTFEWELVSIPENIPFLITSDNPIIRNYGMHSNKTFSIGFAVSPNLLFLAYERDFELSDDLIVKFILLYNLEIIKQSDCFVFSKYSLNNMSIINYKKAMIESLRPIVPQEINKA